tara:strand:- start:1999 stop:2484 length:486 start_codon:yes stop_codon:yes gene_type:complete
LINSYKIVYKRKNNMHLKIINFFFYLFLIHLNVNVLNASNIIYGAVELKKSNTFLKVEIADTIEKRRKGLMFRKFLDKEKGMLFVLPSEDLASVWMKNTLFSLDIIFISKDKLIVDFIEKTIPLSEKIYTTKKNIKYILEVNSGLIESLKIRLGDEINIEY